MLSNIELVQTTNTDYTYNWSYRVLNMNGRFKKRFAILSKLGVG